MNHEALRRAAILVTTLDTPSADALLSEMSPEQAASIRHAIMELGDIDIVEQQEVVAQFVSRSAARRRPAATGGVELDESLASRFAQAASSPPDGGAPRPAAAEPDTAHSGHSTPFAFLQRVDPGELARLLAQEHPQTLAIVVAHLPSDQAAQVVAQLPRAQQTEALIRVARLTPPHPDVLRDLEREIQSLLTDHQVLDQVAPAGLARVQAILQNTAVEMRWNVAAELSKRDQVLARQLGMNACATPDPYGPGGRHAAATVPAPPHTPERPESAQLTARDTRHDSPPGLRFEDLEQFPDAALARVLHHCNSDTTLLALAGASHRFVQRIAAQLTDREGVALHRRIQNIGPLRLDDVQRAQQILARTAQSLVDQGELEIPPLQRLSVAA